MCNNSSNPDVPKTGYDLPIYGLDDGSFYVIHIMAITIQCLSIICVVITITASFMIRSPRGFFRDWPKRDRFVIYMAICDVLYDACHLADHINVFVIHDHVHPKGLCVFYAFDVLSTFLSQILLVNLIAVNAFAMIFCKRNLNFGRYDWKLLVWVYCVPNTAVVIPVAADKFGPTGAYCFFDGVTGSTFYLFMTTVPAVVILSANIFLYLLTCAKLYKQTRSIKQSLGRNTSGMKASFCAAKSMALFVSSYIIQWTALTISGVWVATGAILPKTLVEIVVFFSNLGGTLNLIVFIILRRTSVSQSEDYVAN